MPLHQPCELLPGFTLELGPINRRRRLPPRIAFDCGPSGDEFIGRNCTASTDRHNKMRPTPALNSSGRSHGLIPLVDRSTFHDWLQTSALTSKGRLPQHSSSPPETWPETLTRTLPNLC